MTIPGPVPKRCTTLIKALGPVPRNVQHLWKFSMQVDSISNGGVATMRNNKSFKTSAILIVQHLSLYFPRPVSLLHIYPFIHRRGREPYWRMFRM